MAQVLLKNGISPSSPSAGYVSIYGKAADKLLYYKDEVGVEHKVNTSKMNFVNYSTAAQVVEAGSARAYVAGSNIAIAAGDLQVGTMFRWTLNMSKGSAGSTATTFDIAFGTAGTTADTARVSMALPATGSAVADEGNVIITGIHRGPVGASGVAVATLSMSHNLAATGLAGVPSVNVVTVSSGFDVTTPTNIGLCFTTGNQKITFQVVTAEIWNA